MILASSKPYFYKKINLRRICRPYPTPMVVTFKPKINILEAKSKDDSLHMNLLEL